MGFQPHDLTSNGLHILVPTHLLNLIILYSSISPLLKNPPKSIYFSNEHILVILCLLLRIHYQLNIDHFPKFNSKIIFLKPSMIAPVKKDSLLLDFYSIFFYNFFLVHINLYLYYSYLWICSSKTILQSPWKPEVNLIHRVFNRRVQHILSTW